MLVSAPESILQSVLTCLQSGPSDKETSSRAFSPQDMGCTFIQVLLQLGLKTHNRLLAGWTPSWLRHCYYWKLQFHAHSFFLALTGIPWLGVLPSDSSDMLLSLQGTVHVHQDPTTIPADWSFVSSIAILGSLHTTCCI